MNFLGTIKDCNGNNQENISIPLQNKFRTLGLDIMVGLEKDKYMDTLPLGQSNWTLFKIVIV